MRIHDPLLRTIQLQALVNKCLRKILEIGIDWIQSQMKRGKDETRSNQRFRRKNRNRASGNKKNYKNKQEWKDVINTL